MKSVCAFQKRSTARHLSFIIIIVVAAANMEKKKKLGLAAVAPRYLTVHVFLLITDKHRLMTTNAILVLPPFVS